MLTETGGQDKSLTLKSVAQFGEALRAGGGQTREAREGIRHCSGSLFNEKPEQRRLCGLSKQCPVDLLWSA